MHIDIKHLHRMPDNQHKRYLYVGRGYLEARNSQSAGNARALHEASKRQGPLHYTDGSD